ncbi:hypothetical protein Avbf_11066, partial [Armadillidium vulgare]
CEKGVLRIWTVSKNTPLENCVLKDTGFHCLDVLNVETGGGASPMDDNDASSVRGYEDSNKNSAIPKVCVLSLFKDGGIGIYHLRRQEWIFKREHGHTETIFDCSFKTEDSDLLATGSFDGSIKIWRVDYNANSRNPSEQRYHYIFNILGAGGFELHCCQELLEEECLSGTLGSRR